MKTMAQIETELKAKRIRYQKLKWMLELRDLDARITELEAVTLGDDILNEMTQSN